MTTYFKVKPERVEYMGTKFFLLATDSDTVLQVCSHPGPEIKRGRTNAVGIYTISRNSFVTNYLGMGYVEPINEPIFKMAFYDMVNSLSEILKH